MIDGVLLDLSGVIYEGDHALPGAVDAVARLRAAGLPVRFLTNTTRSSRRVLLERIRSLGLAVDTERGLSGGPCGDGRRRCRDGCRRRTGRGSRSRHPGQNGKVPPWRRNRRRSTADGRCRRHGGGGRLDPAAPDILRRRGGGKACDALGLQVVLFAGLLTITVGLMPALGPLIAARTFAPSRRATSVSIPGLALAPYGLHRRDEERTRKAHCPASRANVTRDRLSGHASRPIHDSCEGRVSRRA